MKPTVRPLSDAGLFAVPGLRGAAVGSGVKPSGDLDLALIVADEPMSAAGVFTTNRFAAAPVHLCRDVLETSPAARSVVVNSGNANAMTGAQGERDASAMAEAVERSCGGPVLVLSTGIIGVPLPIDRVLDGIGRASVELVRDADDGVSRAILTTDHGPKSAAAAIDAGSTTYTVGGIAKGAGMIHPNMATMLAIVATDAPIESGPLREILKRAVDRSFHQISIDGDTSTNDSVILLARRPAEGAASIAGDVIGAVEEAITRVCRSLADQIVRQGEGVDRVMDITVRGGADDATAQRLAEAIACSTLVKTALTGADPNWGRILSAAGAAAGATGLPIEPGALTLRLADQVVFKDGEVQDQDAARLDDAFSKERVEIDLTIGAGLGVGRMTASDLTKRYVEINSEYTT